MKLLITVVFLIIGGFLSFASHEQHCGFLKFFKISLCVPHIFHILFGALFISFAIITHNFTYLKDNFKETLHFIIHMK